MSQNERRLDIIQLNYQWLVVNLWSDNEEHGKSAEKQVIGSEEDAEETRDEEDKGQEVIPNLKLIMTMVMLMDWTVTMK